VIPNWLTSGSECRAVFDFELKNQVQDPSTAYLWTKRQSYQQKTIHHVLIMRWLVTTLILTYFIRPLIGYLHSSLHQVPDLLLDQVIYTQSHN
jgi:hypothetical protein